MFNHKKQPMRINSSKPAHKQQIEQFDSNSDAQFINGRKKIKLDSSDANSQSSIQSDSDSGIIKFDTKKSQQLNNNHLSPWMTKSIHITDPLLRFHNEIIEFYNYIKPSKKIQIDRIQMFHFIKSKILNIFPKVDVVYFGSLTTQLYLPDGDIDIAVLTNNQYNSSQVYDQLNKYLCSHQNSNLFTNVEYIKKSKVPRIKFTYNNTLFDISVDKSDGIDQIKYVQKINICYPQFKYLTFVLKCTLKLRGLGDTYTGGIGSFLLACLLLFYLTNIHKTNKYLTLGQHIIQFIKFYTFRFDNWWENKVINVRQGLITSRKYDGVYFSCLCPQNDSHDIGKSAFKIKEVFKILKNRCNYILDRTFEPGESVLRVLINPYDQPFRYLKPTEL